MLLNNKYIEDDDALFLYVLVFQYLPQEAQLALFSATMPEEVLDLTKKFMKNPQLILVK